MSAKLVAQPMKKHPGLQARREGEGLFVWRRHTTRGLSVFDSKPRIHAWQVLFVDSNSGSTVNAWYLVSDPGQSVLWLGTGRLQDAGMEEKEESGEGGVVNMRLWTKWGWGQRPPQTPLHNPRRTASIFR